MTSNINQLIEKALNGLTVDETTQTNDSSASVHSRITEKPGINKGGQHSILLTTDRKFLVAWTPHHKFHSYLACFTAEGPAEVHWLVQLIKPLIQGKHNMRMIKGQIFDMGCICFGLDNHFSRVQVENLLGSEGMSGVFTCWHDHLPKQWKIRPHSIISRKLRLISIPK